VSVAEYEKASKESVSIEKQRES